MDENNTNLGKRIEELLRVKHMTQKELAIAADITEAAVSHYIKGDRIPRSAVLSKIAVILDTTSDFLIEGTPQTCEDELRYAKRLLARNADQMSMSDKREILSILLGDKEIWKTDEHKTYRWTVRVH